MSPFIWWVTWLDLHKYEDNLIMSNDIGVHRSWKHLSRGKGNGIEERKKWGERINQNRKCIKKTNKQVCGNLLLFKPIESGFFFFKELEMRCSS